MSERAPEEKIGRYEVRRLLGQGAMGAVYLARDPFFERDVALKTIRLDSPGFQGKIDEARKRFLREAKITGRLQHPNIVVVYEFGEDAGQLFLAMEFVGGGSLAQRMEEQPSPFGVEDRIRIAIQVAEALAHAHERDVLHRDIKPANILLTPHGDAKVSDFGIGKLLSTDVNLTSTGQLIGSPAYMSPEQVRGEKLDARADIFCLGIVMYQLFTGCKPFPAETLTTLVYQILHHTPDDPRTLAVDFPPEISPIIFRCLTKDRNERYGSAAEVAEAIREALPWAAEEAFSSTYSRRARGHRSGAFKRATPSPDPSAPVLKVNDSGMGHPERETIPDAPHPARAVEPDSKSQTRVTPREEIADTMPDKAAPDPPVVPDAPRSVPPSMPPVAAPQLEKPSAPAAKLTSPAAGPVPVARRSRVPLWIGLAVLTLGAAGFWALNHRPGAGESSPAPETGHIASRLPSTGGVPVETPPEASGSVAQETPPPSEAEVPAVPAKGKEKAAKTVPTIRPTPLPRATPEPTLATPDVTLTVSRGLKLRVEPDQARVFLDGKFIGIADDWDDRGGGSLLVFVRPRAQTYSLRIAYPGYADLNVLLTVDPKAKTEFADLKEELSKGTPVGPTGPEGKIDRPDYQTTGRVRFDVKPKDAMVVIDGQAVGAASAFEETDLELNGPAVHEVAVLAGDKKKVFRVLVSLTTGSLRATVKAKL